jgi:hypothetical protein
MWIESGVIDVIDHGGKLVVCDGGDNNVSIPCFAFGEVGSASGFVGG